MLVWLMLKIARRRPVVPADPADVNIHVMFMKYVLRVQAVQIPPQYMRCARAFRWCASFSSADRT